jgi:hypothetical protein
LASGNFIILIWTISIKTVKHALRNQLWNQRSMLLVSLLFLVSFLLVDLLKSSFTATDANVNSWAASIQTSSFTAIAEIIACVFGTTARANQLTP